MEELRKEMGIVAHLGIDCFGHAGVPSVDVAGREDDLCFWAHLQELFREDDDGHITDCLWER